MLSDVLSRFRRVHPEVEVTAVEHSGEHLEHLLIGGELDVAVMVAGDGRDRIALHTETLAVSPYRLWLPLGHPLAARESVSLSDVTAEPLIMLRIDDMEEEAVNLLSALGQRPRVAFRTRSVEAVRSLVATGAGVALLPDLIYRPWSLEGDRIESEMSPARCPWSMSAWSGARAPPWRRRRGTSWPWRRMRMITSRKVRYRKNRNRTSEH